MSQLRLFLLGAAAVFVLLLGPHFALVHRAVQAENTRVTALWNADRARTAQAAIAAAAANATETERRLAAQKEATDAAEKRAAQARADAEHTAAALAGLRHTLAAATASRGAVPGNPAPAADSSLAAQVGNVLAACAAEYRTMGLDAEDDRSRGLQSNANYDALGK